MVVFVLVSGPLGWAALLFLCIAAALLLIVNHKLISITRWAGFGRGGWIWLDGWAAGGKRQCAVAGRLPACVPARQVAALSVDGVCRMHGMNHRRSPTLPCPLKPNPGRHVCRGCRANHLSTDPFWFKKPALLLHPIKYILFLCSFLFGSAVSGVGILAMTNGPNMPWAPPYTSACWASA